MESNFENEKHEIQTNSSQDDENSKPSDNEPMEQHPTGDLQIDDIKVEYFSDESTDKETNIESDTSVKAGTGDTVSGAEPEHTNITKSNAKSIIRLQDLNIIIETKDDPVEEAKKRITIPKTPPLSVSSLLPKLPRRLQEIVAVKLDFTSSKTRVVTRKTTVEKEVKEASEKASREDDNISSKEQQSRTQEKDSVARENVHNTSNTEEGVDGNNFALDLIDNNKTENEMNLNEGDSNEKTLDIEELQQRNAQGIGQTSDIDSSTQENNERTAVEDTLSYLTEKVSSESDDTASGNDGNEIGTDRNSFTKRSELTDKVALDKESKSNQSETRDNEMTLEHSSECDQPTLISTVREAGMATLLKNLTHLKRKIENIDLQDGISSSSTSKKLKTNPNNNPVVMVEKLDLDRISNRVNIVEGETDDSLDSIDSSVDASIEEMAS